MKLRYRILIYAILLTGFFVVYRYYQQKTADSFLSQLQGEVNNEFAGAQPRVNPTPKGNKVGPDFLYPDPTLTPGATNPNITQANINQNICNKSWSTSSIRPPVAYTNKLKSDQLVQYRFMPAKMSDFEEDHFISLELGGSPTSPLNLWPENYHTKVNGTEIGAKSKDRVENRLHSEVCAGIITLQKAQEIIVSDWFSCYLAIQNPKGVCK